MKTRTPVEMITCYSTTVDTIDEALAFVVAHLDRVGGEPNIHIGPCRGDDNAEESSGEFHFHALVEGVVKVKTPSP